jgi:hypothetical protein
VATAELDIIMSEEILQVVPESLIILPSNLICLLLALDASVPVESL